MTAMCSRELTALTALVVATALIPILDTTSDAIWWNRPSPEEEEEAYVEAATALASSGVDMLFLEMMKVRALELL